MRFRRWGPSICLVDSCGICGHFRRHTSLLLSKGSCRRRSRVSISYLDSKITAHSRCISTRALPRKNPFFFFIKKKGGWEKPPPRPPIESSNLRRLTRSITPIPIARICIIVINTNGHLMRLRHGIVDGWLLHCKDVLWLHGAAMNQYRQAWDVR